MIAGIIRALVAAGATPEMILAAVEASETDELAARETKRANARERQRRHRASQDVTVTERDSALVTPLVSPKEIPHTPLEITPSPSLRSANQPTRVRASRVPENFVPDVEAAYDAGLSEQETLLEVANFLDYWRSKPTNATKLDWPATWRVWCRKAAKERGSTQGRAPPRQRSQNGFAAFALELDAEQNGPRIINGFSPAEHAGPRSRTREVLEAGRVVDAERPGKAGRAD